jgi:ribosome-associated protein
MKKAIRPVLIDLRGQSDLCDYQFICSGQNSRQVKAIADAVEQRCRAAYGVKPSAIEGKSTGNWILMDYGYALVNIFFESYRDYYALESLWPRAKFMDVKSIKGNDS